MPTTPIMARLHVSIREQVKSLTKRCQAVSCFVLTVLNFMVLICFHTSVYLLFEAAYVKCIKMLFGF